MRKAPARAAKPLPFTNEPRITSSAQVIGISFVNGWITAGIESIGKMNPDSTMVGIIRNIIACCACCLVRETSEISRPMPMLVNMNSSRPTTTTASWPLNGTRNHSVPPIATSSICAVASAA